MIIHEAINGLETTDLSLPDPRSALSEFYRAFNQADIALMSNNWEKTEEASMSNPLGGVKRGWDQIRQVYERIFGGSARVYVEFYDYTIHHSGVMFVAVGHERGYFQQDENKITLSIRTSRTYRLASDQWRQIHHHGSIDNPALLEQYQRAVQNS